MNYKNIIKLLNIFLPVLIGCLVYLCLRNDSFIIKLEQSCYLFYKLRQVCYIEFYPKTSTGIFIKYHLSDFCWAYSLGWTGLLVIEPCAKSILISSFICIFNEYFQLLPFINATFDFIDLFVYELGILISFLVYKLLKIKKFNEFKKTRFC